MPGLPAPLDQNPLSWAAGGWEALHRSPWVVGMGGTALIMGPSSWGEHCTPSYHFLGTFHVLADMSYLCPEGHCHLRMPMSVTPNICSQHYHVITFIVIWFWTHFKDRGAEADSCVQDPGLEVERMGKAMESGSSPQASGIECEVRSQKLPPFPSPQSPLPGGFSGPQLP